jgi:DNA replication protein DnaC
MYPKSYFYDTDVPERHRTFVVSDNKCPKWSESYELLKDIVDNKSLVGVLGTRGCGKTQASAVLVALTKSEGLTAFYVKAFEIFLMIRDANGGGKNSLSLMETNKKFLAPHLLVIDAFQMRADTDFESRTLLSIIDKRYDAGKPTILISNDTQVSFLDALGADGASRLKEGGGIVHFRSDDFRGRK